MAAARLRWASQKSWQHSIRAVGPDGIVAGVFALTIAAGRGVISPRDPSGRRQMSDSSSSSQPDGAGPLTVSVVNEFPEDLYDAMRRFVSAHPSWDQYRVMQVAVAGFLFQQGSRERAVARHYLDGLFDRAAASDGALQAQTLQNPMLAPLGPVPAADGANRSAAATIPSSSGQAEAAAASHASPCLAPVTGPLLRRQGVPLPPHRLR